ncbi:hypothetical protein GGQ80_001142 [Sphingomonas jinjuensis]|uniref:Uncharacterized protein n=1 Tax=Sphingomonas jinjuensis TaxID=535907 RepID=A0A840FBU9_9SPHN|nr:hypothetical protein [Sphingomonas jinjuensis]MBB4153254.1 hypothetical protein [Sphingomonas jinjuensis]
MTAQVIPFPRRGGVSRGTIHIGQTEDGDWQIAHESASGNSWGNFSEPFEHVWEAIAAARTLNRETYGNECDLALCAEAEAEMF